MHRIHKNLKALKHHPNSNHRSQGTYDRFCDLTEDSQDELCKDQATSQPYMGDQMKATCHCPPECQETEYHMVTSAVKWPSDYYWSHLAEKYNVMYDNKTIDDEELEAMELNNLKEKTSFNNSMHEILEQVSLRGCETSN